ncbi:hypothetical protein [Mucilaginibacter terrae]|uniref:Uncharacterized protein (DUF736 family) n=1 Tax=Mucilaginibacter terrae TaxID=1955052 RepID=A0ABU3GPP4_9SPHI|nr:hypothetical protein [Mucilaginibacter terrae]MDT3401501.1 uncharacterized protein (DUF736 family) [Mucilaginibacter terrae]
MFEISTHFQVNSLLPVITSNYNVLHFDEHPILFSGTNKYNNKIIGSLAYEDYDEDYFRYFIIIIDDKQYYNFFNRKISYLDLIKENQDLFVVDKDINGHILTTFYVTLDIVPADFLPLENSFIPEQKALNNSLNFAFSLKGKLADFHKALVSDVNSINQRIFSYLQESIESLRSLNLEPVIYSQPSAIGSYRLNFDIEFKTQGQAQTQMFQVDYNKVSEFINLYLDYVANILPNEEDAFLSHMPETSKNFQILETALIDVYESGNISPTKTVTERLINNINESANKLSDVTEYLKLSESFNIVEIGKFKEDKSFIGIGLIDEHYKSLVINKLLSELDISEGRDITSDSEPLSYRILVYSLNTETGSGWARLYYHDEEFVRVRLKIEKGEKELSNSVFTKSLNGEIVVDIAGIAIKENGIYKRLTCYL